MNNFCFGFLLGMSLIVFITDEEYLCFNNIDIASAIKELEEAIKPKTCEGCKYQKIDIDRCDFCKRCYSDQYEPKDNE